MVLRGTRAFPFLLLSGLIAGCCCPVAPTGGARSRTDATEPRQVFIDMTTVRIPQDHLAAALGALRPRSDADVRTISPDEARQMIQRWDADPNVHVTQAPKLLALDGQEATIAIGETIRFLDRTAATNQQGGLTFSIEDKQGRPVFVGYRLRVTPKVNSDGTNIGIDLETISRRLKPKFRAKEGSRMRVQALPRDAIYESRLSSRFTVRNGGHVLLGSPEPHEDAEGRSVQVTLLHVRIL